MGARSLRGLRSIPTITSIGVSTDVLPGVDGGHRGSDHDHKAEHAKKRGDRDACNEEPKACKESHACKRSTPPMNPPGAGPPKSVDQLGIFSREGGFHLLEKPLLLI